MSEMSLRELGAIIQNYRLIENICKEWGVSIDEVGKALLESADVRHTTDLRNAIKMALNQYRLKEVAHDIDMPATTSLLLEQALTHHASASTSLREDRPLTKEEFKQRAEFRVQMNLFDEPEEVVISRTHWVDSDADEVGYPCG